MPQSARKVIGSRSTISSRAVRGVLGERLDGLEVEEQVAAGAVPRDPQHLDAVELVAGGDQRVGHHAGRGLEQHVVDRGAVAAVLDDLDRLDVAAGLTDGGRDATEGAGDVGQLDAQQVRHRSAPLARGRRRRPDRAGVTTASTPKTTSPEC